MSFDAWQNRPSKRAPDGPLVPSYSIVSSPFASSSCVASRRVITANASGLTGFLLQLGPFGGAYVHGWGIRVWAVGYLAVVLALAVLAFSRRNL